MQDYTDAVIAGEFSDIGYDIVDEPLHVTELDPVLLRRRPDIRNTVLDVLKEYIIPWTDEDNEEPVDYIDKQILLALKMDPFIEATVMECLLEMGDCVDDEGGELYLPSIFESDNIEELELSEHLCGFREDRPHVIAKYAHLSDDVTEYIFNNPSVRKIVSKLPAEAITKELIDKLKTE